MEKNEKYYSEKAGLSDYILYGTYSIYLLGTVIAVHICKTGWSIDHIWNKNPVYIFFQQLLYMSMYHQNGNS